jgi:predicted permease
VLTDFLNSIEAVVLILMLALCGYLFGKLGWMKAEHKTFLVKVLLNVGVPSTCIVNLFSRFDRTMLMSAGKYLSVPLITMLIMVFLSTLAAKAMKVSRERFGVFVVMCSLSNSIFIGLPITEILFGDAGIPLAMFYYMANTIVFWTFGNAFIQSSGGADFKKLNIADRLKKLLTVPLITITVCIILISLGFRPPEIFTRFFGYFGGIVTPLAMIYIGFLMYETGLKNIRVDKDQWSVVLMRFIIAPAVILAVGKLFSIEALPLRVMTVEASMPVMTQAVILASAENADEKFAAAGMSITTIACLIVVPILMVLFTWIIP